METQALWSNFWIIFYTNPKFNCLKFIKNQRMFELPFSFYVDPLIIASFYYFSFISPFIVLSAKKRAKICICRVKNMRIFEHFGSRNLYFKVMSLPFCCIFLMLKGTISQNLYLKRRILSSPFMSIPVCRETTAEMTLLWLY